jgi:hypothetical protein
LDTPPPGLDEAIAISKVHGVMEMALGFILFSYKAYLFISVTEIVAQKFRSSSKQKIKESTADIRSKTPGHQARPKT